MKLRLFIILVIFNLVSCSDISKETLKSGSIFTAHITVYDDPNTELLDRAVVKLFDKEGDAIATEKIKIRINDQVLKLHMKRGNYYDVTHWYAAENIPNDKRYYFDITMEDSANYELAVFTSFGKIDTKKAAIIKNKRSGGYTIQWETLKDFDEVEVSRGFEVHNENETTMRDSTMMQSINSKKGFMDIEKSIAINDTLRKIEYLGVKFLAKKGGLLNTELLENSTIVATSEFSINVEDILKH